MVSLPTTPNQDQFARDKPMLTWMRHKQKTIMVGTIAVVVPSFVLLYGYGEWAKEQQHQKVATIYGQELLDTDYYLLRDNLSNQQRNEKQQLSGDELRERALDTLIKRSIRQHTAQELGLGTAKAELQKTIVQIVAQNSPSKKYDLETYQWLLWQNEMTPAQFEKQLQADLTTQKLDRTLAATIFPSKLEERAAVENSANKVYLETLTFKAENFTDEAEVDEAGLEAFFKENIEDYRIPEKRKVRYLEFAPADFREKALQRLSQRRLERYFNEHQTDYGVNNQRAIEFIAYNPADFEGQVEVTEEALQQYVQENQTRYKTLPKGRAQFVAVSHKELVPPSSFSDEDIQAAYEKRIPEFTHQEDVRARHILLKFPPNAGEAKKQEILEKTNTVLAEIQGGRDFAEAAKEYSEDPGSKIKGGDLGYFGRGRMVPEFEEATFNTPVGSVTGPILSSYGYHIIRVEDHRQPGTSQLSEVRDEVIDGLTAAKVNEIIEERFSELQGNLASVPGIPPAQTTDWFSAGDEVAGVEDFDRSRFISTALGAEIGKIAVLRGQEYIYLIELLEKQEPRNQSLAEVREKAESDYRRARTTTLAQAAAAADKIRVASAEVTWEALGQERGGIQQSELFQQNAQAIEGISGYARSITQKAFMMEMNAVDGPVMVGTSVYLIKLVGEKEAYLPDLAEVRRQVEADYLLDEEQGQARQMAANYSQTVITENLTLEALAQREGLAIQETDFFEVDGVIPGLGAKKEFTEAAFELDEDGISGVVTTTRPSYSGPNFEQTTVPDRYYLLELSAVAEDHLPQLADVREAVEQDYKLLIAADIAEKRAKQAEKEITGRLAGATPISATQTLDFETLADELGAEFERPEGAVSRSRSSLPVLGYAGQLVRTVLALEPCQITPAIPVYEWKAGENGLQEKGAIKAYVIAQVVGKEAAGTEVSEDDQKVIDQLNFTHDFLRGRLVAEAWIDESSSTAFDSKLITVEEDFFKPYDEEEDEAAGEETEGADEQA